MNQEIAAASAEAPSTSPRTTASAEPAGEEPKQQQGRKRDQPPHMRCPVDRIGDYLVTGYLGKGAFAVVYRGKHFQTGQLVALKLMHRRAEEMGRREATLMEREIQYWKDLDHNNVVKLYGVVSVDHRPCLILEHLAKGSLQHILKERGRLDERNTRAVIFQLFSAIAYCHSRNVVHRDIKPDNILHTGTGVIKLTDFGLCNVQQPGVNLRTAKCGSPCWMAPEAFFGNYDAKPADCWSCGVLMIQCLSGRLPFTSSNEQSLIAKIVKGQFEMPQCSELAQNLICSLVCIDPKKRITAAEAVRHEFFQRQRPSPQAQALRASPPPPESPTATPQLQPQSQGPTASANAAASTPRAANKEPPAQTAQKPVLEDEHFEHKPFPPSDHKSTQEGKGEEKATTQRSTEPFGVLGSTSTDVTQPARNPNQETKDTVQDPGQSEKEETSSLTIDIPCTEFKLAAKSAFGLADLHCRLSQVEGVSLAALPSGSEGSLMDESGSLQGTALLMKSALSFEITVLVDEAKKNSRDCDHSGGGTENTHYYDASAFTIRLKRQRGSDVALRELGNLLLNLE